MGKSNTDLSEGDARHTESRTFIDETLDKITNKTGKELLLGTFTGWVAGLALVRVGKIAAFGLGGSIILLHFASECGYINVNWEKIREATKGSQLWMDKVLRFVKKNSCYCVGFAARPSTVPAAPTDERPPIPPPDPLLPPKPPDPYKAEDIFLEKATFLPPKPVPHSPKISPSSIPNPNPSPSTTKPMETGYPNYGSYLYSIPGYSAFQPISYPGIMQPNPSPIVQTEKSSSDFVPFPSMKESAVENKKSTDKEADNQPTKVDLAKPTDFEEKFTPELISAVSTTEVSKNSLGDSKMSIKSLAQGSGATVTIPSQVNKDTMKPKPPERFSLKTSIPISKIDIKCVSNQTDTVQNNVTKKPLAPINPAFQPPKTDSTRVEIQSNIVIKSAKEQEAKTESKSTSSNSINTLINAAEAINKNDEFRKPDPKLEAVNEIKEPPLYTPSTNMSSPHRLLYSPMSLDTNKTNFTNKPQDNNLNEQKNQLVLIQNKNPSNPKMLLTIQQQNPQVLLQRTNFESKNLQAPSRLSSQSKKSKDDVTENGVSSKVVALKRLHQENCDENDFENLITENQIYGNKIVVKEKSQGTLQEQDLKTKNKNEKTLQSETKNVVLQPNFLYLSNVQFPANLMMIKNNTKITQTSDTKVNKIIANENRTTNEAGTMTSSNDINMKNSKSSHVAGKDIHVLKSNNNLAGNKNNKTDILIQTAQKVIMNPQIVYQVPMIVDADNKMNQQFVNRDYSKLIAQNKKDYSYTKQFDQNKMNDKLYIACPYQMDSKLQPKIVITNIRPKIAKIEEVSSLDLYEKRKRMRRLKYLSNKEGKEPARPDNKRTTEKVDNHKNVITPAKMKAEIYKEFANTRLTIEDGTSESDSDYGEDELEEYKSIIKEYGASDENNKAKSEFLANFKLATSEVLKEMQLERQERILKQDSVASAYIAAGRLDCLMKEETATVPTELPPLLPARFARWKEDDVTAQKKQWFLSQLMLGQVSQQFREDYERTWQEIVKERKRRNGIIEPDSSLKNPKAKKMDIDTSGQLQILTEIKKCVNENNDLIKKRLDPSDESDGESIRVLAEKNFYELNRLSEMADHSINIITGQDRKRDLNPGFDSENIQKVPKPQPFQNYPSINIPNISKIISLKTQEVTSQSMTLQTMTSQAVSMDEPVNCAAGTDMFEEGSKEVACQVDMPFAWPGWQAVMRSYREFDAARKKEINALHRRNTSLRVDGAHITRAASCHSDRARALLAERQNLAVEENRVRGEICRIMAAIDAVKNYSV